MFSIKNFIKNLQNKPEATRVRILWVSVAFCMLFVIGIWLLSFKNIADKNKINNSNSSELKEKIFKLEEFKKETEDIPSWDELKNILKQAPKVENNFEKL